MSSLRPVFGPQDTELFFRQLLDNMYATYISM